MKPVTYCWTKTQFDVSELKSNFPSINTWQQWSVMHVSLCVCVYFCCISEYFRCISVYCVYFRVFPCLQTDVDSQSEGHFSCSSTPHPTPAPQIEALTEDRTSSIDPPAPLLNTSLTSPLTNQGINQMISCCDWWKKKRKKEPTKTSTVVSLTQKLTDTGVCFNGPAVFWAFSCFSCPSGKNLQLNCCSVLHLKFNLQRKQGHKSLSVV